MALRPLALQTAALRTAALRAAAPWAAALQAALQTATLRALVQRAALQGAALQGAMRAVLRAQIAARRNYTPHRLAWSHTLPTHNTLGVAGLVAVCAESTSPVGS